MVVLAVDTSTNVCTAALMKDRGPAHEISVEVRSGHSGRLLPVIDTLFGLSPFSKEDVGLIAVGVGPGSFTGIRIAIATARGLSLALGCPLVGVNTLDALAWGALPSALPVMPVIDARKSEVFCRLYAPDGNPLTSPMNLRPANLGEIVSDETLFIGNGVELYREVLSRTLGTRFQEGPEHLWYPRASVLGRMALLQVSRGEYRPAQPLYVRPSDAALALERMKPGEQR